LRRTRFLLLMGSALSQIGIAVPYLLGSVAARRAAADRTLRANGSQA
jgi:hypothetical protein